MTDDNEDDIIVAISDFLDGTLTGDEKQRVADKIASDPKWQALHAEALEGRGVADDIHKSGLQKQRAPVTFQEDVTATIHKRSAGRFFGRRTLGDKVPFTALLVVAVLGLAAIGYIMYSSQTGSLKVDKTHEQPAPTEPIAPPAGG